MLSIFMFFFCLLYFKCNAKSDLLIQCLNLVVGTQIVSYLGFFLFVVVCGYILKRSANYPLRVEFSIKAFLAFLGESCNAKSFNKIYGIILIKIKIAYYGSTTQ